MCLELRVVIRYLGHYRKSPVFLLEKHIECIYYAISLYIVDKPRLKGYC
jgi:hypothetical protein